eukprot:5852954-Ditylum_brightwellii.AAC.1
MDIKKTKHLDADLHAGFSKGDWLGMLKVMWNIVARPSLTPSKPEFNFNIDKEAAHKNSMILKNYGYDMTQAIAGNKSFTMWYGSKFRTPNELRTLFGHHDHWHRLEKNMEEGAKYP